MSRFQNRRTGFGLTSAALAGLALALAPAGCGSRGPQAVAPALRDQAGKYGPERLALPLGGTALVVAYNRAAFDREPNRAAAKEAGLALRPPQTWDDLDALAKFFHGRDWSGSGKAAGVAL